MKVRERAEGRDGRCSISVRRVLAIVVVVMIALAPGSGLRAALPPEVDALRAAVLEYDAQQRAKDAEIERVRGRATDVAAELAEFDREESLGPLQRAQYSRYKQLSEDLADRLAALERQRREIDVPYREAADALIALLEPEVTTLREAWQSASPSSDERRELFVRYETLFEEVRDLRALFTPTARFLRLDVTLDDDDGPDSLRVKADLLADLIDLNGGLLDDLESWHAELRAEREMLQEAKRLAEEQGFFGSTDPFAPDGTSGFADITGLVVVPENLREVRDHLDIPTGGVSAIEDLDRLVQSVDRLVDDLRDDNARMAEKRRIALQEARRREELER